MPTIHQRLAKNIRSLMAKKNITAEQLALEIDKDKGHVSRILSGKKKANLDLVALMAEALGEDVATFFRR
jgi:transcriptional regulator with XRE-family HTH domain